MSSSSCSGGIGQHGRDGVFQFVHRHRVDEVGGGRLLDEVLDEEVGGLAGVDPAVFELDRHAVFLVHHGEMKQALGGFFHSNSAVSSGAGGDLFAGDQARGIFLAAGGDLVGDIAQFHQAGARGLLLDKGADARNPLEVAIRGQFAQRPIGGHAADAEAFDELVLGRHARARFPDASQDVVRMWSFTCM